MRLIMYLDDLLLINESKEGADADFERAVYIFEHCGFKCCEQSE